MTGISVDVEHSASATAGIQEAIDALPEKGGTVFVPAGRYLVRRSIRLRSGVTLCGEGAATVLTRRAPVTFTLTAQCGAHADTVEVDSAAGLQAGDEIIIADVVQRTWHSRQFVIQSIEGTTLKGEIVAGNPERSYAPQDGAWGGHYFPMLHIPNCDGVSIKSLTIHGGDYAYTRSDDAGFTCMAVHATDATDLRVHRVTVKGWPADGIGAQRGGGVTVTHCLVEGCLSHGFHPGTHLSESLWTNNVSRRNLTGFFFCLGVRHAVVTDNIFVDNHGCGIDNLGDPDRDNVVRGNLIARNGLYGIEARGALNNVIAGNIVQDNSQRCPGAYPGIYLSNHVGNVVEGNRCHDTQERPTQSRGLVAEEEACENLFANNLVTDVDVPGPPAPGRALLRAVQGGLEVNGKLDKPAWQGADQLPANQCIQDGAPTLVNTGFRLLHDETHLYLGARCEEPFMDRIFDQVKQRGGKVWKENAVEMIVRPPGENVFTYHLSVNTLGTLFEKKYKGKRVADWHSQGRAAVHRAKGFWSIEIAIPLASFGLEIVRSGDMWRGNFSRHRTTARPFEISAWSTTYGGINRPERFGYLTVE